MGIKLLGKLVNDIKADTARINRIIVARTERDRKLDTLSALMNSANPAIHTLSSPFMRFLER